MLTSCCPTGAVWWANVDALRLKMNFYGPPFCVAPMPSNEGLDIDTAEDLQLAELLVKGQAYDGNEPLEIIHRKAFEQ